MTKYGKKDFIKKYAEHTGVTLKQAEQVLNDFQTVTESFVQNVGDSLNLINFIKFEKVVRAQRNGVNPKTQERITIPATERVKATLSKKFGE